MTSDSTTPCLPPSGVEAAEHVFDNWFVRSKLVCAIGSVNSCKLATGHRNGHPTRSLMGSSIPDGQTTEWKCKLRAYQLEVAAKVGGGGRAECARK
jgi:hypothetical protein